MLTYQPHVEESGGESEERQQQLVTTLCKLIVTFEVTDYLSSSLKL